MAKYGFPIMWLDKLQEKHLFGFLDLPAKHTYAALRHIDNLSYHFDDAIVRISRVDVRAPFTPETFIHQVVCLHGKGTYYINDATEDVVLAFVEAIKHYGYTGAKVIVDSDDPWLSYISPPITHVWVQRIDLRHLCGLVRDPILNVRPNTKAGVVQLELTGHRMPPQLEVCSQSLRQLHMDVTELTANDILGFLSQFPELQDVEMAIPTGCGELWTSVLESLRGHTALRSLNLRRKWSHTVLSGTRAIWHLDAQFSQSLRHLTLDNVTMPVVIENVLLEQLKLTRVRKCELPEHMPNINKLYLADMAVSRVPICANARDIRLLDLSCHIGEDVFTSPSLEVVHLHRLEQLACWPNLEKCPLREFRSVRSHVTTNRPLVLPGTVRHIRFDPVLDDAPQTVDSRFLSTSTLDVFRVACVHFEPVSIRDILVSSCATLKELALMGVSIDEGINDFFQCYPVVEQVDISVYDEHITLPYLNRARWLKELYHEPRHDIDIGDIDNMMCLTHVSSNNPVHRSVTQRNLRIHALAKSLLIFILWNRRNRVQIPREVFIYMAKRCV